MKIQSRSLLFISYIVLPGLLKAQEKPAASTPELADKLSGTVSNLISLPLQSNLDYGIGPHNGSKYTINFQPVVPIRINQIY